MRAAHIFVAANGKSEQVRALLSHAHRNLSSGYAEPSLYPPREVESYDEARQLLLRGVKESGYAKSSKAYDALIFAEDRSVKGRRTDIGGYRLPVMLDGKPLMKPRKIGVVDPKDRSTASRVQVHIIDDVASAEAFLRDLYQQLDFASEERR